MKTDRKTLASFCCALAANLETRVRITDYDEFGWTCITFETDAFGGVYANIHLDHKTGIATNWFGHPKAVKIESLQHLASIVRASLAEELRARDFDAINDMIADQY